MSLTGPLAYFRSNLSSLLLLLSSRLPHTPHICKPRLRAAQNYWLPKRQRRQAPAVDESSAFLPHCNWADKGGEAGVACTRHTQRDAWGGGMPVASRGSNSSIVHTVAGRKELDRTSPDWNRPTPLLFHHHYSIQNSIKMLPPTGLEWRLAFFCAPGENSSWWFAHTYWDTGDDLNISSVSSATMTIHLETASLHLGVTIVSNMYPQLSKPDLINDSIICISSPSRTLKRARDRSGGWGRITLPSASYLCHRIEDQQFIKPLSFVLHNISMPYPVM